MLHLHNIFGGIWFMEESFSQNFLPLIASFIKGDTTPRNNKGTEEKKSGDYLRIASFENGAFGISEYGSAVSPEDAPENSVAIISISGAITKHDQDCGPAGMLTKANLLTRCYANQNISAIVLHIESGGGEGLACRLMQQKIAERNKTVVAFCDDFCASAAYGIAAVCDQVIASNEMTRVGSIGTYITIADYSQRFEQMGIKLHEIYASKSTDKNKDYRDALDGKFEAIRTTCDKYNESFLSSIANGRKDVIDADQGKWGTGKMFFADEALALGLIDQVDTLENVINYFNT